MDRDTIEAVLTAMNTAIEERVSVHFKTSMEGDTKEQRAIAWFKYSEALDVKNVARDAVLKVMYPKLRLTIC